MRRLVAAGLVRMDAEARVHALVRVGKRERLPCARDRRRDRDDPRSTPAAAARASTVDGIVGIEVRVRVDHTRAPELVLDVDGSSLRKSGFGSSSACPGGSCSAPSVPTHVV